MSQDLLHPYLQKLQSSAFNSAGLSVVVYRLDLAHPHYSGNKFYKLNGLARRMVAANKDVVVSFGGRWSNHLLALSQYGKDHGIKTIAVVRDVSGAEATPLLSRCKQNGMRIEYVDAASYRLRNSDPDQLLQNLGLIDGAYVLAEGGSSEAAISSCGEIVNELSQIAQPYDHIVVPVGTGATMAGIVAASDAKVHGVAVTKKYAEQELLVGNYLSTNHSGSNKKCSWSINRLSEMGAYGHLSPPLIDFIHRFEAEHTIPLDPNYTAKAFYWFDQAVASGKFCAGESIVLLHTGGLMGRLGYPDIFAP